MSNWYDKYLNIPFKHLGTDPNEGLDCFNLCSYVLKTELRANIQLSSMDFCNIVDDDWYNKVTESPFLKGINSRTLDFSWDKVTTIKTYDLVLLNIGSTNVANHSALYVGQGKILHTMQDRCSWVSPYGNYYKQYTLGIYRWTGMNN